MAYIPQTLLLAALSVTGWLGLHYLGNNDGLFPLLEEMGKSGVYPVNFTSNKPIKDLSVAMLGFFHPVVDGTHPALSLASYYMFGQLIGGWVLAMVEGNRAGNKMRFAYFTSAFGVAFQVVGGAVIVPAWLMLHLLLSPTPNAPNSSSIAVSTQSLAATPWAVLFGTILPTILACLPTSLLGSPENRINAILFWQLFPVWTNLFQAVFTSIVPRNQQARKSQHLRSGYLPIVALGAFTHVSALTLATSAYLFPAMYNPKIGPQLAKALFSFPPHPFSDARITSAGEGAFWFIQYDSIVCGWAFLIWGATLRSAVWKRASAVEWVSRIGSILLNVALMGPIPASTLLVWERDVAVMEGKDSNELAERKKTL